MKKIIPLLLVTLLMACGGGGSSTTPAGSIKVEGDIKNDAIVLRNYLPDFFKKAFAATFISTRSTLEDITDPIRYDDISKSIGIIVNADVINTTASSISGYRVDIAVEDEQFITKESWSCNVCYSILDGQGTECEGLYEVLGNNLFETEPEPTLPTCDASTGTPALCVTQFNNDPDCSNPSYVIEYAKPGDGLWTASAGINIPALSNLVTTVGLQSSGWLTGTDKYARFTVYDQNNVIVAKKDYVFNVVN